MKWTTVFKIAFLVSLCVILGIVTSWLVEESRIGMVVAIVTAAAGAVALTARSVFGSSGAKNRLRDELESPAMPDTRDSPK